MTILSIIQAIGIIVLFAWIFKRHKSQKVKGEPEIAPQHHGQEWPKEIQFSADGSSQWAGMADYVLISPNQAHRIELTYHGEVPHGDSYHIATIDGKAFPGCIWGCNFAFSSCSRYVLFGWSKLNRRFRLMARESVVVDLQEKHYSILPEYIHDFTIVWPTITERGPYASGKQYTFKGNEKWLPFLVMGFGAPRFALRQSHSDDLSSRPNVRFPNA